MDRCAHDAGRPRSAAASRSPGGSRAQRRDVLLGCPRGVWSLFIRVAAGREGARFTAPPASPVCLRAGRRTSLCRAQPSRGPHAPRRLESGTGCCLLGVLCLRTGWGGAGGLNTSPKVTCRCPGGLACSALNTGRPSVARLPQGLPSQPRTFRVNVDFSAGLPALRIQGLIPSHLLERPGGPGVPRAAARVSGCGGLAGGVRALPLLGHLRREP